MILKNEKQIDVITYDCVSFEIVERPEVLWVGKIAFAPNLTDEPDIGKLLKEYQELIPVEKKELINPEWDAAISIDYWKGGSAPRGMMFGSETYSDEQAECYDVFKMPPTLFMRVLNNKDAARLLGKENCENWELFEFMKRTVLPEHGYKFNENGAQEVEYYHHNSGTCYAYVPVVKVD